MSQTSPESVTVPIEPTREMWAAMANAVIGKTSVHHDVVVEAVYRAMVTSAPAAGHAQTPDLRELATKLLDFIDAEGPEAKAWQPISETAAALRSALSDTSTDRDDKRARQIEHGRKRPAQNNPDGYPPDSSPVETKGA